ncbi:MAG TPA: hypothetical protein VFT91_10795, partial [Dehalococcoidia bacterium]|nr:hypothetical protein [Dehalococcoidia bacterium]
ATFSFPIEVFCVYKGQRYSGKLSEGRTITVNGETYSSPSRAAMSITHNSVNGWRWWWYVDPTSGQTRQIDDLRARKLV